MLTPVQRLSMTANLVIFLGLLYTLLYFLAWFGVPLLTRGSYHPSGLLLTLSVIALGYGVRYGSRTCLGGALLVSGGLTLYFALVFCREWRAFPGLRFFLSAWVCWRLWQAVPLMRDLQQGQVFPLPMSSYGTFVLRRLRARRTQ